MLMKLPDKSPDPVIYFLAGTVPIEAHIHRRQLSLFGMISRLPSNILFKTASTILASDPDSSKSWFVGIRKLCLKYSMPSPLHLLQSPPTKSAFKKLVKSKILDFWETSLRSLSSPKTSLLLSNQPLCLFQHHIPSSPPALQMLLKPTKVCAKLLFSLGVTKLTTWPDTGIRTTLMATVSSVPVWPSMTHLITS